MYKEDTDDPMDEDASSYLIHTALNYKNFRVGLGYYEMSAKVIRQTGIFLV